MLLIFIIFFLSSMVNTFGETASNKIKAVTLKVDSLDSPVELSGKWLFTRDDKKENATNEVNLNSWKVVKLPSAWTNFYGDKKLYNIAWHKRVLSFDEKLIGQKVNLYAVTFWPQFELYIDGKLILSQGELKSKKDNITTGGMVATFKITKKIHTISIRFDSFLMKGFHAKPFQLRAYKENDFFINLWDFLLTDILIIGGAAAFMAGLLFLFVFLKTKETDKFSMIKTI